MDEESKRKVVEGLILFIEDIERKTDAVISLEEFEETKYNLRLFKKSLEIIEILNYFPSKESKRLFSLYNNTIKNAEVVFGTMGNHKQNLRELMNVIR